jgi:uncharacterized protein
VDMLFRLMAVFALCYVIIVAAAYCLQGRLLYFPLRDIEATPAAIGCAFEDVYFQTEDGIQLHGWYIPAPEARATVLFCHGNAGNISHRLDSIRIFHGLGLNVFIFDYRGYGRSSGRPGEQGTTLDALAAWHWLAEVKGADPVRLIIFGRSLGAAVAAGLACTRRAAAVILESAFTSCPDIGAELYPWLPVRLIAKYRYATIEKVASLTVPVLIVHSPDDEIVPFRHGCALFDACVQPKYFMEISGGHNDGFLLSGNRYVRGLDSFIGSAVP